MRAVCTICADTVKDEFSAAPCGHTFHGTCLDQWLAHQKTCPQCRIKCTKRQVLKLFLESGETIDTSVLATDEDISTDELKERVKEQHDLYKQKDEALRETLQELRKVKEELSAWRTQHDSLVFKLREEKSLAESLRDHMKLLQREKECFERKADESMELRRELTKLTKIDHLLKNCKSDATLQEMLDRSSYNTLKDFTKVLKNDYDSLKKKLHTLQEEKKHHMQDMSLYKKKVNDYENELNKLRERLALVETDLHSAESERDSLTKKIHLLEKAIESPNTRVTLRRLLESPLPDRLDIKRPKLDLSASLNGSFLCASENSQQSLVESAKVKSVGEELSVPVLVSNPAMNISTSLLRTGFNGLGGHTNFIKPNMKPSGNKENIKQLKFAPRNPKTVWSTFGSKQQPTLCTKKFRK